MVAILQPFLIAYKPIAMPFQKGQSVNPGGKRGNRLARNYHELVAQDIVMSKGGTNAFALWMLDEHPDQAIRFVMHMAPRQLNIRNALEYNLTTNIIDKAADPVAIDAADVSIE